MKISRLHKAKNSASSLVVSLLVIVLLSVILVAFVQTMSLARANSKGYAEFRKATLAAEAGLDMAITQLIMATSENPSFVTGITNFPNTNYPLVVIGQRDLTNAAQLMPLVSGPTNYLVNFGDPGWETSFASYANARTSSDATVGIDVNTSRHFIQQTNNANLYRASWVVMTNTVDTKTNFTRFAYVIVDDTARVNPTLHTGKGTGMTNAVDWYSGPKDIALTNAAARLLTPDQLAEVLGNPESFQITDATLGQSYPNRATYEANKHFFTAQTNATYDMIPGWLADAGKPKYNINELATSTVHGATASERAMKIADIIGRNLTNFHRRDPVLRASTTTAYLNRLAANIVDYIDQDSDFTPIETTADGGAQIGGLEMSVFPYRIAEKIHCIAGGQSTTPHTQAIVESQYYVGIWNPSAGSVTVTNAQLRVWNRPDYKYGNAIDMTPPEYKNSVSTNYILQPNEFGVLAFPPQILPTIKTPIATTNAPISSEAVNGKFVQYELIVNNQVVARSQGADANKVALAGGMDQDDSRNRAYNAAHGYPLDDHVMTGTQDVWLYREQETPATLNDPRFARFAYTVWGSAISENAWTRVLWKGSTPTLQDFATSWAQRDYVPRNATEGIAAPYNGGAPDLLTSRYQVSDANVAPGFIRNGNMQSIGELGFIYDPAHAADDLSTNNPAPSSSQKSLYKHPRQNGGARTLRIGQTESTGTGDNNWNTNGQRAMELLDLFTVDSNDGAQGRINPNTAPPEVLAAILSSIKVAQNAGDPERSLANSMQIANRIVANRPYSSLSDLYKIASQFIATTNYSPAPDAYLGPSMARLPKMADRTREEAFGKLIPHLTVQSRSYRIYAIGQVLDTAKNPRGSVAIEAGISLKWIEAEKRFQPVTQYVRTLK